MSNRRDIQFTFNPHNKATILDCSFIVDHSNGNGLGIRSLKNSGRIANVYMNTSATPAAGNPNPQAGIIVVQLQDNYNRLLSAFGGRVVPLSGSNLNVDASDAALTIGNAYVITSLGTSTAADWVALGVPANITPAVGVAFIAAATGAGTGTGHVQVPASTGSGIFSIEALGDANLANSNGAYTLGNSNGMQLILACYKANGTGSTPLLAAPADGTVISLVLYMNNSAQGV